ncbi:phosphonate ABC transporter permease [Sinorhizobium fredii USDA 205]|uniref:Phosphonate ABC transporter, permease protein PhnE n=1 Tax=Rhizobium fredii TaxID=380 RepID=A0A844AQT2_RHIFR|nr:phosphonate ABC transporter, permease protein PhnE [Sinorhizobium fredii]ASY72443.1 Phosphonate ABC transporter permease protein phnE2 [Sinorhizobium fredii CCBAU 83666]KSV92253.1 phosphonate ABC transporter permease [Sinorhizobium fredii USDA 205]MQX12756.1 phosphonate ABC transporter, permease protein PhnE [Sinorhizobium fredii]GEC31314.1 phosphonate ABC transporter, permease protein PhnE [Sinorhizobium fredii]GLS10984.1 phosphonate ABC transporter, permease protein PhnE [Sinorhizobium fr
MATSVLSRQLSENGALIERHWQELSSRRRLYTTLGLSILALTLFASLWFANDSNAGKFVDRLPHFFDFVGDLMPRDAMEIGRALLDLPSPYDDGSFKYNYPEGRLYLTDGVYIPEYVHKMLETVNIAIFSTVLGVFFGFILCFLAARNLMPNPWIRGGVRRLMEVLRAFPEVVIAGFFLAILSLGPIPAIAAVSIHTIGALGKLFFEVVENADMKPEEGLRAVGANWIERVWFGIVPQVMPNFVSYFLLRLEINVRASTIIGAVGGGGIGELLRLSIGQGHQAKTLAIVLLLFATIFAVDQFSAWLRRRLVGDQAFELAQ